MCVAERVTVVEVCGETAIVSRTNGKRLRVSLLALTGDRPVAGDTLVVHSGVALYRSGEENFR